MYGLILCPLFFCIGGVILHQALYRKWRPAVFTDVVGQDHITKVLEYEAANGKLSHAYLFCGSRGTGKTTCAKILAKAANCKNLSNGNPCNKCDSCLAIDSGTSLDVLEMDAASNTGVDYIRDIREEVLYTPSEMGTRVYIIDEVHMLSESAFNALLKTLEEPPSNVIFILATTEIQKIPATIISRCQRFDFRRIPTDKLVSRLEFIAEKENIKLTTDGARLIARLSQGGMRDSISMLELCAADGAEITSEKVSSVSGAVGRENIVRSVRAIIDRKPKILLEEISSVYKSSRDIAVYLNDLAQFYRDMMVQKAMNVTKASAVSKDILDVSDNELSDISALSAMMRYSTMVYHSKLIESALISINRGADKRITAEMLLIRMCNDTSEDSNEALSARIDALDEKLTQLAAGGTVKIPIKISADENKPNSVSRAESDNKIGMAEKQSETNENDKAAEKKPYENWQNITENFGKVDKGAASFLINATAEISGGDLLIINLNDEFAKMLLTDKKVPEAIMSLAASYGDKFSEVKLAVNKKQKKQDNYDDLF